MTAKIRTAVVVLLLGGMLTASAGILESSSEPRMKTFANTVRKKLGSFVGRLGWPASQSSVDGLKREIARLNRQDAQAGAILLAITGRLEKQSRESIGHRNDADRLRAEVDSIRERIGTLEPDIIALGEQMCVFESEHAGAGAGHADEPGTIRDQLAGLRDAITIVQIKLGTLDKRPRDDRSGPAVPRRSGDRLPSADEAAAHIGVSGFDALRQRDFDTALRAFHRGQSLDADACEFRYGEALARFQMGDAAGAREAIGLAVAAERQQPPAEWYKLVMMRVQGPARLFLENARNEQAAVNPR